ncbi:MAG TPA: type VI secretion system baseplate subunit TssE [Candidatus Acidoferrum sp.]
MAERDTKRELLGPVTLSVLDRLLDNEPKSKVEGPLTHSKSLAQLKLAVRRDLENLLNTRCTPEPIPESSVETLRSAYSYGVPDITEITQNFLYEKDRLLGEIERVVRLFEPRLGGARVAILPASGTERVLRFVIEGMLKIDPTPEHVVFDAALELTSGEYQLMGDASAG